MRNQYEIGQNYILKLENEALREKVNKLVADYKELKKEYDKREKERLAKHEGNNATFQERQTN